jgi:hypothetical protein
MGQEVKRNGRISERGNGETTTELIFAFTVI